MASTNSQSNPSHPTRLRRADFVFISGICALSLILLLFKIRSIPGLHGDEAWILFRIHEIAHGARPVYGMNGYTGALHQYLLWPLVSLLGVDYTILRAFSAVTNTMALFFAMLIARRLYSDFTWLWTGLLIVTSSCFVAFSRFPVEITALTPVLILGGILLLLKAEAKQSKTLALLGGFCFGLAAYNHISAVTGAVALGLSLLCWVPNWFRRSHVSWLALAGALAGLIPFLAGVALRGRTFAETFSHIPWKDILYLPRLLSGILDGTLVYKRFVGGPWIPVIPYFAIAAAVLMLFTLKTKSVRRISLQTRILSTALLFWILLLVPIVPGLALRYFFAMSFGLQVLLVRMAAPLIQHSTLSRRLAAWGLLMVVATNCSYLSMNYFVDFSRTQGLVEAFKIGKRLVETSAHFVPTDILYRQLRSQGIKRIWADHFIAWPMEYYRKEDEIEILPLFPWDLPPGDAQMINKRTVVIYYNGLYSVARKSFDSRKLGESLKSGRVRYQKCPSYDSHFLVFEAVPNSGQ